MVRLPTLYHPKEEDYMILETDASHGFWGGILKARNEEGIEQLCRYTSGSFQGSELNYHSNEKEYLAIKKTIKKFSIYIISKEFEVRTDSKNFTYFLRTNIEGDYKQGRLLRWQQWFNYYKFKVVHIPGVKNSLADAMSRELASSQEVFTYQESNSIYNNYQLHMQQWTRVRYLWARAPKISQF